MHSFVTSIFLYACELWTLTAELQRRVRAMEMSCCHCKDHVTDEEVCQDPASNLTTQRPPDHRKKMQTAVVCSCFPFIRSSQNHLARHSKRGKKTRQAEKEMGKRYQGMDRPGVGQVLEGSGEQRKMEETGCEINCGAPITPHGQGIGEGEKSVSKFVCTQVSKPQIL